MKTTEKISAAANAMGTAILSTGNNTPGVIIPAIFLVLSTLRAQHQNTDDFDQICKESIEAMIKFDLKVDEASE